MIYRAGGFAPGSPGGCADRVAGPATVYGGH
jgi:hypothetical protein